MRFWIKLYTEIVRDPKMGRLSDRQFRTCINLFALAGTVDEDGKLPSIEDLAWHLRMDDEELTADLEALARVKIVELKDGTWFVCKWADRQAKASSDQPERIKQRVRNYRERKRNENVTSLPSGVTTPEKRREEKIREDTEKIREDTETDTEKKSEEEVQMPIVHAVRATATTWDAFMQARAGAVNGMDSEQLGELEVLYGADPTKRAIEYANAHKDRPLLSLAYVGKVLAGWQKDGNLDGANGNRPKRKRQQEFAEDGSVVWKDVN